MEYSLNQLIPSFRSPMLCHSFPLLSEYCITTPSLNILKLLQALNFIMGFMLLEKSKQGLTIQDCSSAPEMSSVYQQYEPEINPGKSFSEKPNFQLFNSPWEFAVFIQPFLPVSKF